MGQVRLWRNKHGACFPGGSVLELSGLRLRSTLRRDSVPCNIFMALSNRPSAISTTFSSSHATSQRKETRAFETAHLHGLIL
jgi:hypothetical protein